MEYAVGFVGRKHRVSIVVLVNVALYTVSYKVPTRLLSIIGICIVTITRLFYTACDVLHAERVSECRICFATKC